jgi:hypothetical protein
MAEITYREVWQQGDARAQDDAIAFWRGQNLLPAKADHRLRAAQLCVVAYEGDQMIAVSTINVRNMVMLKGKFAMFRCAASPDHRRGGLATQMAARSRRVIEAWSAQHLDRQILGMACVVQGPELSAKKSSPIWPQSGMNLAGYNNAGQQIRVAWFAHAVVS